MYKTQDRDPERDPFLCTCGPCKRFWRQNFKGSVDLLYKPPIHRAANTSIMFESTLKKENHPAVLKIGDRVLVKSKFTGTVKYVGILDENLLAPQCYVGVHLDDNVGSTHNGVINGRRYFHCPRGHGALVKYGEVTRINPPEKRPPVRGNDMFPSWAQINDRRKKIGLRDPTVDMYIINPQSIQKHSAPASMPHIQAAASRTKHPKIYVTDKNDIAVKDALKQEAESRQRHLRSIAAADQAEQANINAAMQRWRQKFAGYKNGDRMAQTLRMLHRAYEKGEELKRREEAGQVSDDDEEEEEKDKNAGEVENIKSVSIKV